MGTHPIFESDFDRLTDMEDGVAAKRNQRKVAEELKQLIKAVKDTYTQDTDAELEQRINRTRQAEALEQMGNVFEEATEDFILESPNTRVRAAACRLLLLTLPGFEVQP